MTVDERNTLDELEDCVWVVMNLDKPGTVESAFEDVRKALRLAASIVGNNSYAGPMGDIYLFGPGDGSTTVMVRQLPRAHCLREDVFIIP